MLAYLLRRLGAGLVQVVLITFVTWFIFYVLSALTGAGPAERVAGKAASPEQVQRVAHELGTDRPYPLQFVSYVWRLAHGDLGYSFQLNRPVADVVLPAAGATASLVFVGLILWLLIAIPIGVVGALRPRSRLDRGLMGIALVGISVPAFWLAPLASYYLAFKPTQGAFPVAPFPIDGYVNLHDDPVEWLHHLLLPALVFATGTAAIYARFVRALVLDQLVEDYVRTARAKGASTRRVVSLHVGRNVAPIVATMIGTDLGVALAGALFIESVFTIPGLGYVALRSIRNFDYPLTLGVITFAAVVAVVATTAVDVVQAMLDPRVRSEASG